MAIMKIVKTSVALIGLAATTYFVFTLYKDYKHKEVIRVVEEQEQIRIALENAAIKGFAEVVAKCTANSLSDEAMEEFIIYETMPILAESRRGSYQGSYNSSYNLSWPPFESLKKHCKAQELDAMVLPRTHSKTTLLKSYFDSLGYINTFDYGIGENERSKRNLMNAFYWEALSETKLFKAAQKKLNSQQEKILASIMQENTKQVEKKNNDQQSADHWIFKKP